MDWTESLRQKGSNGDTGLSIWDGEQGRGGAALVEQARGSAFNLLQFPKAAITKCKLSGLKFHSKFSGLKRQYCLTVLEAQSPKTEVLAGPSSFWQLLGEPFLAASSFWSLPAILGVLRMWMHCSGRGAVLSLRVFTSPSLCVCLSLCPRLPFREGYQLYWISVHSKWPYFVLLSSVKTLFANKDTCWGTEG